MSLADQGSRRVSAYNVPAAADARLLTLAVSRVEFGPFSPTRYDYIAYTPGDGGIATLTAVAAQADATLRITPADHDGDPSNGYHVRLEPGLAITVTVTSPDGSRTRVYRLRLPAPEACLRGPVAAGLSLVTFGGGSVYDLADCAGERGVRAIYTLQAGAWLAYALGAPSFVNQAFADHYASGVPPWTPFVVVSAGPPSPDAGEGAGPPGPWPECLRGDVGTGFSLVTYEGGSVDDLAACAAERGVTALYTLHDGAWLWYSPGLPDSDDHPFRARFAEGLPSGTPLVVRAEADTQDRR